MVFLDAYLAMSTKTLSGLGRTFEICADMD
jgi:hypothetical protein